MGAIVESLLEEGAVATEDRSENNTGREHAVGGLTDASTGRWTGGQVDRWTGRWTGGQVDRWTGRWTGGQVDRWTDDR